MQIVLGVDPGLTRCGVAVVAGGPEPSLRFARAIRTSSDDPIEQRLLDLYEGLRTVIDEHEPTAMACERVLFNANVRTAMGTGQALGVALLAGAQAGLAVRRWTPTAVKLAVAGHGGASKGAVARMVAAQLGLAEPPRPADAADAAAIALCHLASANAPAGSANADASADWEDVLAARGLPVRGGTGGGAT